MPPSISKGPSNAVVEEESNTELNCEVLGAPTPAVSWLLNGESVNNDSHITQMGKIYLKFYIWIKFSTYRIFLIK